jgi:hypothetical protein
MTRISVALLMGSAATFGTTDADVPASSASRSKSD